MATYRRIVRSDVTLHRLTLTFAELQAVESALDFALAHEDDSDAANILEAIENPES